MTFEFPAFLLLLLLLLPVFYIRLKQKQPSLLFSQIPQTLTKRRYPPGQLMIILLELLALALLIVALGRPRSVKDKVVETEGLDIVLAVDVSLSMDLKIFMKHPE